MGTTYRSRGWACAQCGELVREGTPAWTIDFNVRPWVHVVHDACKAAYDNDRPVPKANDVFAAAAR